MSRKRVPVFVCALAAACSAQAANKVDVWDATGTYTLVPEDATVLITSAGAFKMQATDPDGPGGLGRHRR